MKRIILFFSFLILTTSIAVAQSLSLSNNGDAISNGDEINFFGDSTSNNTIYSYIDVTNNTGNDLDVLVKKVELSLVSGSENTFCWGVCFTPSTYVSPSAVTISANSTTSDFYGEYMPKGNLGESKIMYVFYPENDENDSVAVVVNYNATPVGIEENSFKPDLADAYPNPADNKVFFKYDMQEPVNNAKIIIRNMIGSIVKEQRLTQQAGKVSFETYDLNEGIYFYSYIIDDETYVTRKLIVKHR
ncbi:MAG: T9SS type A sorting domain-containing protein [Bacteroidales bacterium]|nr:T9SS type A sorting domain-containing protein [Bacteroidales bacterium]MCF8326712.1 T9SS type A sorting domain-containing protein [Bacteroidales bacterium]